MGKMKDAIKKLGLKMNGKEPKADSISGVVNQIANDFDDGNIATKNYVNSLMSGALKRQIVVTLPVEDIDTNTIYMVLDQSASQQGNVYNEYLYINNAWELIGTTATSGMYIDLLDYEQLTTEQMQAIEMHQVGLTYSDRNLFLAGFNEEDEAVFTSTVYDGEYTQVTFIEVNEDEETYFTFEVETISVGGSGTRGRYLHQLTFTDASQEVIIKVNIFTDDSQEYTTGQTLPTEFYKELFGAMCTIDFTNYSGDPNVLTIGYINYASAGNDYDVYLSYNWIYPLQNGSEAGWNITADDVVDTQE